MTDESAQDRHPVDILGEEFADRLRQGETPSITEFVQRMPEHEAAIRAVFPSIAMVERVGAQELQSRKDDADRPELIGPTSESLGEYRIVKEIGRGGMAIVYEALEDSTGLHVALKVLPRDQMQDELLVKRFKAEARAAQQLQHANIVNVLSSGEIDGFLYIAMEFIDGIDVLELVRRKGVLSVKRSVDIMKQVALALEHAHARNIVHRDIKPSNLLIDRTGTVKLADMGLARSLTSSEKSGLTKEGTTVGTVDYMSPEQTRDSRSADCRSDIYSLGATWYHMLTGQAMFPEGDLINRISAHASEPVPDPRELNEDLPDGVVAILHRMVEKDPDDRYQTMSEFLHELKTANLKRRELTVDVLASLADADDEEDDSAVIKPAPQRQSALDRSALQSGRPAIPIVSDSELIELETVSTSDATASDTAISTDVPSEEDSAELSAYGLRTESVAEAGSTDEEAPPVDPPPPVPAPQRRLSPEPDSDDDDDDVVRLELSRRDWLIVIGALITAGFLVGFAWLTLIYSTPASSVPEVRTDQ